MYRRSYTMMYRRSYTIVSLACMLALLLVRGGTAQPSQSQHHPGGSPPSQATPAATEAPEDDDDDDDGAAPRHGMMGHGGMMGHRGMMGHGGMMLQHHLQRLTKQLQLSDEQRTQAQTLLHAHAKDVIRLQADIDTMGIDLRQLLHTEPVDLAKVKPLLHSIAAKEADVRLAHITAMQDLRKLLTPEQQKQFRTLHDQMMDHGSKMGRKRMLRRGMMERGSRAH